MDDVDEDVDEDVDDVDVQSNWHRMKTKVTIA